MKQSQPLLVIYDGHCSLCRASMDKLERMLGDRVQRMDFRVVPPEQIHPDLSVERCQAQMHVVEMSRVYGAAEAMVRVLRLHRGYRLVVWLYDVPPFGWLAERAYQWVARNRFRLSRWFGKQPTCTDTCTIHQPSQQKQKEQQQ